jgi:hypothetical protein
MKSNADQFALMGNPWITERDRAEMPTYSGRKIKRHTPRYAEAKPEFRDEVRVRRELTAAEAARAKALANLARVRSALRQLDPAPLVTVVPPKASVMLKAAPKLDPLSSEAIAAERDRLARATAAARAEADAVNARRFDKFAAVMAEALGD